MMGGKRFYRQPAVFLTLAITTVLFYGLTGSLHAQEGLGWEGETGVFVTPSAYTASAENQKVHPVVAFHYFNGGPVLGGFYAASTTVGLWKRTEVGYTHEFHTFGNDPVISPLFQNGLDVVHGKVNLIPENFKKTNWVPAISVGFKARFNDKNVGDMPLDPATGAWNPAGGGKSNGDIYFVATKIVRSRLKLPIVLNYGLRGSNAMLWGLGGNAPNWQALNFGAIALPFKISKTIIFVGSEAAQQPHHPVLPASLALVSSQLVSLGLPPVTLNIPTSLTYDMRVIPSPKCKLAVDFGVGQLAGRAYPGIPGVLPAIDLKARHQVGFQVTYGF
ncbi:MAG: DUF3034 family protein [Acidobacteriaceae bacterium]|nr:DUF3034 family protein [Acidobacteriaceae bacterium]